MSRSYKKNPGGHGRCKSPRWMKRQASKAVRRSLNVPSGGWFKRCFCSWNIIDYKWIYHGGRAQVLREYTYNEKYWQQWMK